ncbi:MAG: hypothetical protein ACR2HC_04935 [Thermoleophilaceae bacterium]
MKASWPGGVELLVRAIAANRRALLPLRDLFPELGRTVKDPWRSRLPRLSEREAVRALPDRDTASVRIDPELTLQIDTDGPLGRGAISEPGLVFTRARQRTAEISGPAPRLELLARVLEGRKRLMPSELQACLLPRGLDEFADWCATKRTEVSELLDEGRVLVEVVERIVCRLYDVPLELEEAVVLHAAGRAVAGLPAED